MSPRVELRRLIGLGLLVVAAALGGCAADPLYTERTDSVSLQLGDAVAANKVAQTIDPWPAVSRDNRIAMSGERAKMAMDKYKTNLPLLPPAPSTKGGG